VIAMGIQLAGALREAHAGGVIHRDLKPSNVLVTEDGDVKVLDFGLALLRSEASPTQSAVKLEGTVQYIAPEVLRGGMPDERSDIYSLGAVLYEMATGRAPHSTENFAQMVESILYKPPVPPEQIVPGLSASLVGIIKQALANIPANRYQSAADLRADLVRLQSGTQLDLPRVSRRNRRRWTVALVVALPILAMVLLLLTKKLRFPAILPQKKVVAVLPFEPIGDAPENRALSRGLTELITVRLAQASQRYGIEVIPASEIRSQEITSADQARQRLGANLVVEGSWDFGSQQRIMYALVDAEKSRNLNAAVVRADLGDVYSAENSVLQQLLGMLDVELGQSASSPEPAQPNAYQSFVRGRGYLWDYQNPDSLDHAIDLFKTAIEGDPKFAEAYASLGEAYWRKYENTKDVTFVELATHACNRAETLNRNISEVHSTLGLIYRGTGRYADAVRSFQEALKLDRNNDTAYRGLAASYEAKGEYDKAESTYRQAIAARPDYWGGYHDLGVYYFRRGNFENAANEFQREMDLAPDNVRAYTDLGAVYYLQNKIGKARELYLKSIQLQPNYRAYANLGTLEFFDQNYQQAALMFEKARDMNDRDYRIWHHLAASYDWSGQKGKAANAFQKAADLVTEQLKVNPNDISLKLTLADCYSKLGRTPEAERLLAQTVPGIEDAHNSILAAQIYEQIGQRSKALAWVATAAKQGYSLREIERDPTLASLRQDHRFTTIERQLSGGKE
jgi:tetratricopeptide (TPR) repeat protein